MPDVTIDVGDYQRFELKTAPPDGYIMLRPLPYGQKLARRSQATRMTMEQQIRKRGQRAPETQKIEFETFEERMAAHDFAYCIGEHNLTDKNGVLLDFTKPQTLKFLNPKVGSEIERLIDNLNEDEDEESLEDFLGRSSSYSEEENGSLNKDGSESTTTPVVESLS